MFSTQSISTPVYLLGFTSAVLLSLFGTFITIKLLNTPNYIAIFAKRRKLSGKKSAVTFGGVPVIVSFLIVLWSLYAFKAIPEDHLFLLKVVTAGVILMTMLGVVDDLVQAKPLTKFIWQFGISIFLFFYGVKIYQIGGWLDLGWAGFILTVFWIVGISNSLNLIDGQDGLASGIIFLSCLTLTFVYHERGIFQAPLLALVLAGAVLGFLVFNFPPAKIILGDTGSLPLGLMMSIITLLPLSQGYTDEIFYIIPITTLLVPIMDTLYAILRRIFRGVSPFSRDTEHFHHKLERLGYSPLKSVLILYAAALYFDLFSFLPAYFINLIPYFVPIFFVLVFAKSIGLVVWLRRKVQSVLEAQALAEQQPIPLPVGSQRNRKKKGGKKAAG